MHTSVRFCAFSGNIVDVFKVLFYIVLKVESTLLGSTHHVLDVLELFFDKKDVEIMKRLVFFFISTP